MRGDGRASRFSGSPRKCHSTIARVDILERGNNVIIIEVRVLFLPGSERTIERTKSAQMAATEQHMLTPARKCGDSRSSGNSRTKLAQKSHAKHERSSTSNTLASVKPPLTLSHMAHPTSSRFVPLRPIFALFTAHHSRIPHEVFDSFPASPLSALE